jgi:hypothetical protein
MLSQESSYSRKRGKYIKILRIEGKKMLSKQRQRLPVKCSCEFEVELSHFDHFDMNHE